MEKSKDEQIGYHKGALATLAKERDEFVKLINVVESIMKAHIKTLKDLGVDLEAEAKTMIEQHKSQQSSHPKPKLDERIG
ncbi:hypothetical protein J4403_02650 [Candidatus Woesearchaeota archaeon]|nr:hypothetical protein [Candidatus Woesearchaeota archaeon]